MSGIKYHEIIEGNLKATKDTSDFGGPNMWNLNVKDVNGYWDSVQWMNAGRIQGFFKTKIPRYTEQKKEVKYELA